MPDLAEKWQVATDNKTVTFQLRRGVVFHNGMPMTAEDVIYSLDRIRKPPSGIISPRKGQLGNIAGMEAPDPYTVVIHLTQPQADFPFLVSNPFNVIYCKKVAEPLDAQGQGMKRQIVGTGPFRLTQAIDGQIYELSRFDSYFGAPAYLDKIQFFPIKGEVERGAALQGKRIDACYFIPSELVSATLRKVPGMVELRRPTPTSINLIPNVQVKPFDDIRVREALSLAIDRESFIKTVGPLAGASFHSLGLMPPDSSYSLSPEDIKKFGGYDTLPGLGRRCRGQPPAGDGAPRAGRRAQGLQDRDAGARRRAGLPRCFDQRRCPAQDDWPGRQRRHSRRRRLLRAGEQRRIPIAHPLPRVERDLAGPDPRRGLYEFRRPQLRPLEGRCDRQHVSAAVAGGRSEKARRNIREFQRTFLRSHYHINLAWVGYGAAFWGAVKGWVALPDIYVNMQMDKVWLDA